MRNCGDGLNQSGESLLVLVPIDFHRLFLWLNSIRRFWAESVSSAAEGAAKQSPALGRFQ
jgi:hypothetical protein